MADPDPPPPLAPAFDSLVLSDATSFHPLSATPLSASDHDPLLSSSPAFSPPSSPLPLDRPSHADAVYDPLQPENGSSSLGPLASSSCADLPVGHSSRSEYFERSSPIYVQITVGSPQKEQETAGSLVPGAGTYVTYFITSRTADGSEFYVRRRFRDVVALADQLAESFRGFFIPGRPDKSVMESQVMQKQEFVEQRRSALEKYLSRLAAHPVIGRSAELRVFLETLGKFPLGADMASSRVIDGAARSPGQPFSEAGTGNGSAQDAGQPVKGGRDLFRMFRELRQTVVYDWVGTKPLAVEEDKDFLEQKEKLQDLEQHLSTVSQQAEALVKAQQDLGETMGELGMTFIKFAKFETVEAVYDSQRTRAVDARRWATAAVKASRFYRDLNSQTVKHLDTLHEYLGLMLSVHSAFTDRSCALLSVQNLLSELSTLNAKAEKLEAASSKIFGADRSRIRKIEDMKEVIKATEDAKNVAVGEYERIKENNKNELERLGKERRDDFLHMLKGFVVNQVEYSEKIASVWEDAMEETKGYTRERD